MTQKSPSQRESVAGQRPPLDPDEDTVAIPRPADELSGEDEPEQPEGKNRERKH